MFLVKAGVPFDVAFSLDDATRLACCVIAGEQEGNKWNWNALAWDKT